MERIRNALKRDIWILLLDIVAVNLAYFLALAFRVAVNDMGGIFATSSDVPIFFSAFYRFAPIYTILCIVVFFLFKLYGGVWRFAGMNHMYRILGAWIATTLIQIIGSVLMMSTTKFPGRRMPATYYMVGCVLQLLFVTATRFGPKTVADEKRRRAKKADKALVVGAGELGQQTVKMLQSGLNYEVSAIVDTENEHVGLMIDGTPVYGLESLEALIENNGVKCVFLSEPDLTKGAKAKVATFCQVHGIELKERMFNTMDNNEPVTELQFKSVTAVDEKWAEEYKKQFGEEPSFF